MHQIGRRQKITHQLIDFRPPPRVSQEFARHRQGIGARSRAAGATTRPRRRPVRGDPMECIKARVLPALGIISLA
ncbi:MAG TPA: hypothetical protein VGP96_13740, partial [Candidatus Dormibacteraeota bacterium]|nr:hypothetical protein [Candidatus Dormibacteraeota bacterium]